MSMCGSLGLRPMMLVKFYCRCRFPAGKEGASRLGVEMSGYRGTRPSWSQFTPAQFIDIRFSKGWLCKEKQEILHYCMFNATIPPFAHAVYVAPSCEALS